MSRIWKCVIAASVLIVVAAISVPIVLFVRFSRTEVNYKAEIAKIRAAGDPVSAADLTGPPIPDAQNGALVYEKCFKSLPRNVSSSPDANLLGDFLDPKKQASNPKLWAEARTAVARYTPALLLAEQAAEMPKCRFKIDWTNPIEADFSFLSKMRFLARVAQVKAVLSAESGDSHEAARSILLILRMSDSLKEDSALIATLVRYALVRMACRTIYDVACSTHIGDSDSSQLSLALSRIELQASIHDAMNVERAYGLIVFNQVRSGKFNLGQGKQTSQQYHQMFSGFLLGSILDRDEGYYLTQMRDIIKKTRLPYRMLARNKQNSDPDPPKSALFSSLLLPIHSGIAASRDRAIADVSASQILLRLIAYRDRFGRYPSDLTQLSREMSWVAPEDPFSGKPFVYHREGQGIVLYSIGDDLKDNHGRESGYFGNGDIVWRLKK